MNKRTFMKSLGLLTAATLPSPASWERLLVKAGHLAPEITASDEDFWAQVRGGYRLKPEYINLENGYYCFLPQETLENYISHIRAINYQGSYYMRTVQAENKRKAAARLASLAGCSPEELVITRNTTESLDMVIGGQDWKPGDEAVMAEQDYGAMLNMFRQVEKRYGVVNRVISVPNHPATDEEIVTLYEKAITPKTKLLMVCHMINITGQILPVRKICDMAHSKGVKVMVDGAHAFAHIRYHIPDLGCDFYGSSLHKWLSVPLGAGLLYVNKKHITSVWPVFAPWNLLEESIYRLNHTGTHPVATDLAIHNAIDFYEKIGAERKEARLKFLQTYWTSKVRSIPNVIVNTPEDPARSCGIANVGIKGMKPQTLADRLFNEFKIYTAAIDGANVFGCRITPNIYTTTKELDTLVNALTVLAKG
jgi:selenocysteine lyase/cysteine desulfurase